MNTLQVCYRVECINCTSGPYNCVCIQWSTKQGREWSTKQGRDLKTAHSTDFFLSTRPGMFVDFPREHRERMENYYSGFKSRQQLLDWFSKEELRMFTTQFKMAIYIADDWYEGYSKNQIFFVRPTVWRRVELPVA